MIAGLFPPAGDCGRFEPPRRQSLIRTQLILIPAAHYKLRWFERLHDHLASLIDLDGPDVIAGDLKRMPTDLDVHAPGH